MSDLKWRYFGCGSRPGHYLYDPREGSIHAKYGSLDQRLSQMDGILPPYPEPKLCDYKASFTRLGGLGYSALSWWDRTIDSRPASNSTLFAPSLIILPTQMLEEGPKWFPWVFKRLPVPLTILNNFKFDQESVR